MREWQDILVRPDTSILEALRVIDAGAMRLALVVDEERRLIGIVADGDIRRALLKNIELKNPVLSVMNVEPTTVRETSTREQRIALMQRKGLHQLPVVDSQGRLVALETIDEIFAPPARENCVVLMAGGVGSRLQPLTNDCPKPLLRIAEKPLLEIILEAFVAQGFRRFYFSVNYRADMIKSHFGDGGNWGVDVRYLEETSSLGTAGSLSLIPDPVEAPLIVMNGDIMTRVDFGRLLDFHSSQQAEATMCVREYQHMVPYGVVRTENQWLRDIDEKPTLKCFISAGMYVLGAEVVRGLSAGQPVDMPAVFSGILRRGGKTAVFPLHEYWLDIGRLEDFEKANRDFRDV